MTDLLNIKHTDDGIIDTGLLCQTIGELLVPFIEQKATVSSLLVVLQDAIEQETARGEIGNANLCSSLYLMIEDILYS